MDDDVGGIFHSIRFWQGWAVAATLAALFAFAANIEYSSDGYVADYVAIVGGDDSEPMWVINADLGEGLLNVRAVGAQSPGDDQYVLWVSGQHPQRLGVLPAHDSSPFWPGLIRRKDSASMSSSSSSFASSSA